MMELLEVHNLFFPLLKSSSLYVHPFVDLSFPVGSTFEMKGNLIHFLYQENWSTLLTESIPDGAIGVLDLEGIENSKIYTIFIILNL